MLPKMYPYFTPIYNVGAELLQENDVLQLIQSINKRLGDKMLREAQIKETFELWWPKLEATIKGIEPIKKEKEPQRSDRDILEEVLSILRRIDRHSAAPDDGETQPITIEDILRTLEPMEGSVLRRYLGIGQERSSISEISLELAMSKKKVQEVVGRAMRKLKHPARFRALQRINALHIFENT
jgi:hypothetical protein